MIRLEAGKQYEVDFNGVKLEIVEHTIGRTDDQHMASVQIKCKRSLHLITPKLSLSFLKLSRVQVLTCVKYQLVITDINLHQSGHTQIISHTAIKPILCFVYPVRAHWIQMQVGQLLKKEITRLNTYSMIVMCPKLIKLSLLFFLVANLKRFNIQSFRLSVALLIALMILLAVGRFMSRRIAGRFPFFARTIQCI